MRVQEPLSYESHRISHFGDDIGRCCALTTLATPTSGDGSERVVSGGALLEHVL